ncbi:hypothetical protein CYG49_01860, partial [Candidatus Saccharibacteria bacterium]
IFASSKSEGGSGITPSTEVGTLLFIQNGEGGPRNAAITNLKVPLLNFSSSIKGEVALRNSADQNQATGFFPEYTISLGPVFSQSKEFRGPLVFSGVTRVTTFELPTDRVGFYKVEAKTTGGYASKWVFIATGVWRWVLVAVLLVILIAIVAAIGLRRRQSFGYRRK